VCVTSLISENSFLGKEMQFTLLQNNVVAIEGVLTVVTGMLFPCADTQDVSPRRDKLGKNLSS
jgi:hypothetical protein